MALRILPLRRLRAALPLFALAIALTLAAPAGAVTYPAGFEERTIVGGLNVPTGVAWTPDGRMLVIEKEGVLKVVPPGATTATTALDLRSSVNSYHDRGLLGLAVDSNFSANRYVYLLYTRELNTGSPDGSGPMASRLTRYELSPTNTVTGATHLLGTASGLCGSTPSNTEDCIPSEGWSHSIGSVRSAPDGTLYVGSGDAASYSEVDPLAFRTYDERSLAGKILRIDRNGRGVQGHPFCAGTTDLSQNCTKVFAKGFRNPFRFKLRPNGAGLVVGDVGWYTREEVDLIRTGGRSYGWPCYEGNIRTPGYRDRTTPPTCAAEYAAEGTAGAHVGPNHDYVHDGDSSVLGGPTYTGEEYPSGYRDTIFFGDYSAGFVKRLVVDAQDRVTSVQDFASGWAGVDLESAPNGDLVYADFGDFSPTGGSIKRVVYTPSNATPVARVTATPTSGAAPLQVTFNGTSSTDADGDPLIYRWDFGDGTTGTGGQVTHTYTQNGSYTARLTVDDGRGRTDTATVVIGVGNTPPDARITSPADGSLFTVGDTITAQGSATDPEQGTLPASAYEWQVTLVHGEHTHLMTQQSGTTSTTFAARDDHDADNHYEIRLTVRDANGATDTATTIIRPRTVNLTLASSPAGAPVTYVGIAGNAPLTRTAAVNFKPSISAAERFVQNGRTWVFDGWSDGGARQHTITVPSTNTTLTATYRDGGPAGPVMALGFDEGAGTVARDETSAGNDGSLQGPTWTAAGRHGGALTFDGVDDWVTVADANSLDLRNAMTLSAWVKPRVHGTWDTVLLKEAPGNLAYALYSTQQGGLPSAEIGTLATTAPLALPTGQWSHLAVSYDGATARLFVNGGQVATASAAPSAPITSGPLRIGGNSVWPNEEFDGVIDEVRAYDRALSAAEIGNDMNTPVRPPAPDTTPPVVSVTSPAAGSTVQGTVPLAATASDDRGVASVQFRVDGVAVGSPDTSAPYETSWNTASVANGTHRVTAVATDAAGNATTSAEVAVTVDNPTPDTTPPTVSVTAPAAGATVSGTTPARASASDDRGVASVQFRVDGVNLGSPDTTAPYEVSWDTTTVANGTRRLTAVATDAAGNARTSSEVAVTVSNSAPPPNGPVLALGLDDAGGTTARDASGRGNHGTLRGGTWTTAGRHGGALTFDGVDDWVTVADADSLDLTSPLTLMAWVRPRVVQRWDTILLKERPGDLSYGLYGANNASRFSAELGPYELAGPAALATNTWTHIAVTFDGTTTRLYRNGTQVSTRSNVRPVPVSTGALRIGGNAVWPGEFWDGTLDEIRIYDRALTAAQVTSDMNTGVGTAVTTASIRFAAAPATRAKPAGRRICKPVRRPGGRKPVAQKGCAKPKPKPKPRKPKPRRPR